MSQPAYYVMTVLGEDHPVLVESIAATVADHGGNWIESRMAHLAGQFAGIVRFRAAENQEQALREALDRLDVTVTLQRSEESAPSEATVVRMELIGQDRPGIVRDVFHALSGHGINVEELETECISAPMSGETLFKVSAELSVPVTTSVDSIRDALDAIAEHLMVEIDLIEETSA